MLHRPRALLPAIIGCQCDLFAARNTVPARALLACCRCLPETCCHLLPPPATSTAAACFAKTRPEVTRVWRPSWGRSEQSDFGRLGTSLEHEAVLLHTSEQGCFVRWLPPAFAVSLCIVSKMSSFATFGTSNEPLRTPPTPTPTTTLLAPTEMQESSLSRNECALCLRSLLLPSSALFQCKFANVCRR